VSALVLEASRSDYQHSVGNFPESCELFATLAGEGERPPEDAPWQPMLARVKLGPHQQHFFQLQPTQQPVSHVKLVIHPGKSLIEPTALLDNEQTAASNAFV
jgi:allantoicase